MKHRRKNFTFNNKYIPRKVESTLENVGSNIVQKYKSMNFFQSLTKKIFGIFSGNKSKTYKSKSYKSKTQRHKSRR